PVAGPGKSAVRSVEGSALTCGADTAFGAGCSPDAIGLRVGGRAGNFGSRAGPASRGRRSGLCPGAVTGGSGRRGVAAARGADTTAAGRSTAGAAPGSGGAIRGAPSPAPSPSAI